MVATNSCRQPGPENEILTRSRRCGGLLCCLACFCDVFEVAKSALCFINVVFELGEACLHAKYRRSGGSKIMKISTTPTIEIPASCVFLTRLDAVLVFC